MNDQSPTLASQATAELPISAFNIPAGYKLVPLEPTFEMSKAGQEAVWDFHPEDTIEGNEETARAAYVAMLDAAPPVDAVPGEPVAPPHAWSAWGEAINGASIQATDSPSLVISKLRESFARLAASVASRAGSEPVADDRTFGFKLKHDDGHMMEMILTRPQIDSLVATLREHGLLPLPDNETPEQRRARADAYVQRIEDRMREAIAAASSHGADNFSATKWSVGVYMAANDLRNMAMEVVYSGTPIAPAAAAEPSELTTCNCRWQGEKLVQQCTLHEAWRDAIRDWSERAKVAERQLPDRERAASLAASEDTKRLDWLEGNACTNIFKIGTRWYTRAGYNEPHHRAGNLRDAIDRAIAGEAQS